MIIVLLIGNVLQYIHIRFYDIVSVGLGHTRSLQWSGQYSRTFSKRYHWHSSNRPGGKIRAGSSVVAGSHDGFLHKSMVLSVPSLSLLTFTCPGKRWENLKCCIFLMSFNAVLVVCSLKQSLQLKVGTILSPLWDSTNCATFGVAEALTAWATSSRQPMFDFLYYCLNSPKHQSGENLVCPTGRKDIFISLCKPTSTLQIK